MVGEDRAVDEDVPAGDAVVGRVGRAAERVGELVVAVEGAVGEHQRDVARAPRQRQRGVERRRRRSTSRRGPRQTLRAVRSRRWSWYQCIARALGRAVLDELVGVGALRRRARISRSLPDCRRREAVGDVAVERRAAGCRSARRAGRRRPSGCGRRAGGR